MTGANLAAKARRAAEWFRAEGWDGDWDEFLGVMYFNIPELSINEVEMVKYCEDRGWQDQEQEADGVEWRTVVESCDVGKFNIIVGIRKNGFEWGVWVDPLTLRAEGTAPTRAEARRQAVEAARGMG